MKKVMIVIYSHIIKFQLHRSSQWQGSLASDNKSCNWFVVTRYRDGTLSSLPSVGNMTLLTPRIASCTVILDTLPINYLLPTRDLCGPRGERHTSGSQPHLGSSQTNPSPLAPSPPRCLVLHEWEHAATTGFTGNVKGHNALLTPCYEEMGLNARSTVDMSIIMKLSCFFN